MPIQRIVRSGPWIVATLVASLLSFGSARADILIKNVTLYDGTGAPAVAGAYVLVKGERIATVSSKPIAARGARVIDGTGKFLMPGMMDSHIHLRGGQVNPLNTSPDRKPTFDRAAGISALHGYLYSGVTSVYDSGNTPDFIMGMRAEERAGKIVSPRIFATGGGISVPGGYGGGPYSIMAVTWEQTRADLLAKFANEKPDLMKMAVDRRGLYQDKAVPTLSKEMIGKIVAFAHENGVPTTVHISNEWEADDALDVGIDALAHPVLRATLNDAYIERVAKLKTPISTTLVVIANIARVADDPSFFDEPLFKATLDPALLERQKVDERKRYISSGMSAAFKLAIPYGIANVGRLHKAGAILALGTDRTDGPTVHQELELLNQGGISPFDCIRIATLNGAAYVGRTKDLGSIEPGKYADLLLLNADPAADVHNFRAIDTVIKGGKKIDLAALDIPINHAKK